MWVVILKIIFYLIYWHFFSGYSENTTVFCTTAVASILPIVLDSIFLCLQNKTKTIQNISGVIGVVGLVFIFFLTNILKSGKEEMEIIFLNMKLCTISKTLAWFILFLYLLSPLILNIQRNKSLDNQNKEDEEK